MNKSKSSGKSTVERVKIGFDFAVIVVMVAGLLIAYRGNKTAREANRLATQALTSGCIPWVKIYKIEEVTPVRKGQFEVEYHLKRPFKNRIFVL